MKKFILFVFSLIIGLAVFCGLNIKADGIVVTMEEGAQIRAEGEFQGLRFAATINTLAGVDEHGFYLAIGTWTQSQMETAIEAGADTIGADANERKLLPKPATGSDLDFAVTIYGMDELSEYESLISTVAYAKVGATYYFGEVQTRNIADIARAAYNGGNNKELVTTVATATRVKVIHNDSSVDYFGDTSEVTLAANDTLDLTKGNYTNAFTINQNNVTIKGNNFGIAGNGARVAESEFTNGITVNANSVVIDGIKISGDGKMLNAGQSISGLVLRNIYSTSSGVALKGGRTTIIGADNNIDINGLTLYGVRIACTGAGGRSGLVVYGTVTNLDVQNCDFNNGAASYTYSEAIRINKIAGTVNIKNNTFTWSTQNFGVFLGSSSNNATSITYKDNVLMGSASGDTAALALYRLPSGIDVNIVHNTFDYMDASADNQAIALANSSAANVFIGYNKFGTHVAYNCSNNGSANVTHKQNYYAAAQIVATPDYGVIGSAEDLETKYTKYVTPELAGTITYVLNGGTNEVGAPTNYYLYSQIALPTPTKEDYNFLGWTLEAVSNSYIAEMPINQTSNVTLYAQWQEIPGENFNISSADKAVLNTITPDIVVNPLFDVKKYKLVADGLNVIYETNYYRYGTNAFTNISDAISHASAGNTIYVFSGTYNEAVTVNKSLTIIGPNTGINGNSGSRAAEANITRVLSTTGNSIILRGLEFSSQGAIKIGGNDTTIKECYIHPTTLVACNDNNREAAIVDVAVPERDNYIQDVKLIDSKILITCDSTSYLTNYMSFSYLDTLYMRGNYITNTSTSVGSGEGLMVYYMKGTIDILENTFAWPSDGYVTRIGYYSTDCERIDVIDNLFTGANELPGVTLGIQKLTATSNLKIWHNRFINFNVSTFYCTGSVAGAKIDSQYNYFSADRSYKFADAGSATVTTNNNCYLGAMHKDNVYGGTSGLHPDANRFATLEALEAAYTEYLAAN